MQPGYRPGLLDESWYDALIHDYFSAVAAKGYIVEIKYKSFASFEYFLPERTVFPVAEGVGSSCTGEQ